MNNAAISSHIAMYALQLQNVKRNTVKKMDINQLTESKTETLEREESREGEKECAHPVENTEEILPANSSSI